MEPEKRMGEEEPLMDRDRANDFSSGPLAEANDTDEERSDEDEMLDDEAEEEL